MRDKDGFIIRCKYTEWKIVDNFDNEDDVCTHPEMFTPGYTMRGCYGDERCKYYEPDIKADLRDQIVGSGYIYHPPGKKGVKE